jgi:hypothetical protein
VTYNKDHCPSPEEAALQTFLHHVLRGMDVLQADQLLTYHKRRGRPTNAAKISSSSTIPAVEYTARAREILAFWPPLRDGQCLVTDSTVSEWSIPERDAFLADLGPITSLP